MNPPIVRIKREGLLSVGTPILLPIPTADVSPTNAALQVVAGWSSQDGARPIEIALVAKNAAPSGAVFPETGVPGAFAGAFSSDFKSVSQNPGFFKIEYGLGAFARTRIVDLMSARLFLGTCDNVRVYAARWRNDANAYPAASTDNIQVTGSVAEACGGSYDELCFTAQKYLVSGTAAGQHVFGCPSACYAVETGVDGTTALWGSTNPDFVFETVMEQQVYRLSNRLVVPPFRRLKGPTNTVEVNWSAITTSDVFLTARYYLNS